MPFDKMQERDPFADAVTCAYDISMVMGKSCGKRWLKSTPVASSAFDVGSRTLLPGSLVARSSGFIGIWAFESHVAHVLCPVHPHLPFRTSGSFGSSTKPVIWALYFILFFFVVFQPKPKTKDVWGWWHPVAAKKNSEAHRGWLLQLLELVLPPSCAAPSHSLPIIALKARGQNQQKFGKRGRNFFGQLAGLHKSHWTFYTRKKC